MHQQHRPITVVHHTHHHGHASHAQQAVARHDHAVVGLYVAGKAQYQQREQLDICAGDLQLLPAGEPHRLVSSSNVEAWAVGFCTSCLANTELAPLLSPFTHVRAGAHPVLRVPEQRRDVLLERFQRLDEALKGDAIDDTAVLVQRSWLALLLAEVKSIASLVTPPATPRPSIVADALAYIEQRCLENITLADIAAAVSRTPTYVTSVLTRTTGKSAGAWITAGRMAEARRRLLHTDERIDVVAERVGYTDVAHFTRMFSRAHGLPPGAWRVQHRASPLPRPSSRQRSR